MNKEEIFQKGKEEQRLQNLGEQFCPLYDLKPQDFLYEFIPRYLEYYVKSEKRDKYAQPLPLNAITNSPLRNVFNKFDINLLFPNRKWEFSMTETFLRQIKQETNVLLAINSILEGKMTTQPKEIKQSKKYLQNAKFYELLNCKNNRRDAVIVQILPKQKFTLNSQNQLQTLEYVQSMVFICIASYGYDEILRKYQTHQEEDPYLLEELGLIQDIRKQQKYGQTKEQDSFTYQLFDKPKSYRIPNFQADQYVFDLKYQRWVKKQNHNNYQQRVQMQNELKGSYFLLKKYLFTPNFQQYRNLLKNIKSEKFTATMEQFEAIAKQGDTILIGRSGTGKTTISLLKLFITDAIFMLRQNLDLVEESNSKINLQYTQQLSTGIKLKTLFLTSSPLLAQQIKQKYDNLVKNVQQTLREKNKGQKFSEQLKENLDESTVQILDILEEEEESASQFQIEDEEENEEDIDQYEKEMGQFSTMSDIKQFPAFLTIRKLLFLIDSQLSNPFFKNKEQIHRSAQWHNEYFGVLSLNQSVTNNNFQEQLNSEVDDLDSKEVIYHNNNLKEVTLECFKDFFWPKIMQQIATADKQYFNSLDPMLIWSDIINIIKGHENSFKNPNFHLNKEDYQDYYISQRYDHNNKRYYVFKVFLIYEKLKSKYGYYDILDLINHINFQQVYCHDKIEYMHYIILDELQDVPKALLILLNRMTQVQLFLAGDNAQNIVKGSGIKFQDIVNCLEKEKSLKSSINLPQASLIQLSYNFRSTNQILQLGNTLVTALELFFPNYLDFLQKEKSNQQGPKPIVIQSIYTQDLLNYLFKEYQNKQRNIEFGSNSVIIVKDQESKLKIPIELQNAIILTIYEAKGLEFDDVILFNFFADACVDENAWSLFQTLEIVKIKKDKQEWNSSKKLQQVLMQKNISKHEVELTKLELRKYNPNTNKQNKNIFNPKNVNLTLQHELKQLYVAVTRPKQRLIIFDQSLQNRHYIQQIWEELELVEIVRVQQIQEFKFVLSFQIDNKANWKKQGYRMLRQNNYEQAQKCFMFANEIELAKKSMAYNLATQATLTSNNFGLFIQAAQIFEEINLPKRAASCYFSGKNYEKAFKLYQQLGCKDEMAESAYFSGQYQIAGQIFSELGEVRRSMECYNKEQLWEVSLDQLNGNQFTSDEKLMFLNIIIPKYLKQITEDIEKEEKLEQQKEQINNPNDETESFEVEGSLLNRSQMTQKNEINDLENSQSFQVVKDDSLDHLSIFDPDDEWIKPENKSLIKSIASSSIESQFSNVLLMNQPSNTPLLKSRLNIFMKNNVMLKLAERFQQFKKEFKILLENQKSQCALLSFRNQDEKELDHMINFLYDLENFDIEAVYFVLDVLEQFKSYKLCIYVCNQFKLSSHLGRYLVSLASQYTPMTKNNFKLENWVIGNNLKRKRLLDQSMLAQMAFNNILESINPIYLKFKYEEQLHSFNSFGLECYKSLIGLGYWRTIIHQLNYENAVQLCQSFNNFQDLVILIEKVKGERQNNQLTDQEKHQLIKYNYFIQVEQYFIQNQSNKIEIDQQFEITIQCSSKRLLTKDNIVQLINNSKLYKENLTYEEKLKQLESIVLSMLCSMGILKFEINQQYSLIIDLIEQQQYCLNQLAFVHNNPNINEALEFLFKFSFPTGDLMMDFSQYCIIHITSKLIKNVNEQMIFMDIAYEYIAIPFEALGKIIKTYFCNFKPVITLTQAIDSQQGQQEMKLLLKCLKQRLQYQYENILPHLTLSVNDHIDYYAKVTYGSRQKSIVNSVDDHESSILNFTKSDDMRTVHKWLLQQNRRINKMDKQIKYYLKYESILLFEQGLHNQDQKHGYIILALNLLHLQDNLPFAIFTIQNLKKKEDQQYYLKYLEFLECQYFDIIEDSFECFIEYSQYFEEKMYLDESLNHLTRIGIKLLLAQHGVSQVIIPQKYQDIISCQQYIDQPLFKLSRPEIVLEFIEQLQYYIETCNSEHYEYQCNLLLIIFMVNLQNLNDQIKERLLEIFSNNNTYRYYKRLHQCLNQKNPNLQQELIDKMNVLIIKGYFEEQLITIQIKQSTHNLNSQKVYQDCLNKWEGYFEEAQQIEKNGRNLLKKWRQFKSQHQNKNNLFKNKSSPSVIRFQQFHKLQLKDWQSQNKLIEYQSLIIKIYNIQEELLKLRQKMLRGADLQFVNLLLNNSTNLLKEIINGNLPVELFEELKQKYYNWRDSFSTLEKTEQELLERNRQILKLKWQKLQAGVKVQNKFDSHCIKTVDEHIDEESQD